jgi:hypothetical protein
MHDNNLDCKGLTTWSVRKPQLLSQSETPLPIFMKVNVLLSILENTRRHMSEVSNLSSQYHDLAVVMHLCVQKKLALKSCFLQPFHQFIGYPKQMAAAVWIFIAVTEGVRTHQEGGPRIVT